MTPFLPSRRQGRVLSVFKIFPIFDIFASALQECHQRAAHLIYNHPPATACARARQLLKVLEDYAFMSGKTRQLAYLTALSLVALVPSCVSNPAYAQKSASQINVKVGYVNLGMIKASTPASASSEELTHRAEAFLKQAVEESNKRLAKAIEEKKSEDDIKKLKSDLQIQINAKQQAYAELVQSEQAQALQAISAAVNSVASEKGLDLVVDGGGVLAGGQKLLDNGVDITSEVVKKLAPNAAHAGETASKPPASPAKEATK